MSKEIRNTGGLKEFQITKEDRGRWENEDTESTKEFKESLHKWRNSLKYKVRKFFNISPSNYNYKPLMKNTFILVVIGVIISIIYSNLEKLNEIVLLFLKVGSSLLIAGAFFFVKYFIRLYKNIRYFFRIQRDWFKWAVTIVLLILLFSAYQNRDSLFDPIVKTYEETDFGKFSPFTFTFDEINEEFSGIVSDSSGTESKIYKDVSSDEWTIKEKVQEVLEIKPISIDEIEKAVLKYTNEERKSNGLDELTWDNQLGQIARAHSEDMVKNYFFDHINLKGEDPTDRAKKAGFSRTKQLGGGWYSDGIAENIGKMPTGNVVGAGYVSNDADSIAKAQVESWMGSSGHRANILDKQYTHLGVGVAYDGQYYVATQNFW